MGKVVFVLSMEKECIFMKMVICIGENGDGIRSMVMVCICIKMEKCE